LIYYTRLSPQYPMQLFAAWRYSAGAASERLQNEDQNAFFRYVGKQIVVHYIGMYELEIEQGRRKNYGLGNCRPRIWSGVR
jgi:hypothetical protein